MIKPIQSDIGRHVIYTERGDFPGRKREEGEIASFNEKYAFVRYSGSSPIATDFEDLEWCTEMPLLNIAPRLSWRDALLAIRDMPTSEQDNMLSANMRKIAAEALATFPDSVPLQHIPTEFN